MRLKVHPIGKSKVSSDGAAVELLGRTVCRPSTSTSKSRKGRIFSRIFVRHNNREPPYRQDQNTLPSGQIARLGFFTKKTHPRRSLPGYTYSGTALESRL